VKTGRIFGSLGHKLNPRLESLWIGIYEVRFVNHDMKRTFLESGFVTTIRNQSMDLRNKSMFLQISYMILATLLFSFFYKLKIFITGIKAKT
jgi:hypothetical protein